ncbi:RimK family alpha-L-glutamate ligase [Xanthobacteraceae bacterium Astr-EGSB]|uniref:ATP-grasp domain-containing protein n=1 Tax=Astrobacterium formosum TaxID=3069710 RepID=UPI0027B1849B|nr:RimK family alpha-L-glutamate ligase [Xanthobacteraceae bacterium Astr-EGSB]
MPRSLEHAPAAAPRPVRVGLVTDVVDWHARQLMSAFRKAGVKALPMRLENCRFETLAPSGLILDGFGESLPDAVLARTLSGGSFEVVTRRLGILHALTGLGVPVLNNARAIERCVDKSTTSFLLARAGIPTPATWVMEKAAEARAIVTAEVGSGPLVLKPLFGSQGRGLLLIRTADDLPETPPGGVYYLQRFVAVERDGFHDFRLFISGGRVLAAMMRHSGHWITNVKRGGRPVAVVADAVMKRMAVAAAAAVGADFAGVDIIQGADGPTVLEVNSMPAWSGLQQVTPVDVAAALADDVVALVRRRSVTG